MNAIVDRKSRNALIAAINRYLDGETTAFKFDDEIFSIDSEDDPTISYVVTQLWLFYDDLKDHKVKLSKEAWDYFQRLVLILQSDAQIEVIKRRQWDYGQFVALIALLLCGYAAYWLGWGIQLLVLLIPCGIVSIAISSWRKKAAQEMNKNQIALTPFSSISELLPLRRRVQDFRKRKYPPGMMPFEIRSPPEEAIMWLQSYAAWLRFSPLVLAFQVLPRTETETRIVSDNR